MPKEDAIEVMGKVVEKFRAGMFTVELDAGKPVLATMAGRLRRNRIKVMTGDRVSLELSPYDLTRGESLTGTSKTLEGTKVTSIKTIHSRSNKDIGDVIEAEWEITAKKVIAEPSPRRRKRAAPRFGIYEYEVKAIATSSGRQADARQAARPSRMPAAPGAKRHRFLSPFEDHPRIHRGVHTIVNAARRSACAT